ncbi:unnamed protein product [Vitrella brassicaformis CCMP3155]|uniref:Histone deacetylase domain-containing protein n=1 Tax=Vitrella brassicaformis (strain CCMP3155) TaxID=1169540 RepID=A0A0G4EU19_VITBC|nr:unnamed protein product [Vitrella brassicaformis CCMP3155]|eukprot:CEM01890.1 unnamed protein product [Vitrella brassicaformis CCMP3155]
MSSFWAATVGRGLADARSARSQLTAAPQSARWSSREVRRAAATRPGFYPAYLSLYYNDLFEVTLPPDHKFPMAKYREVRLRLQRLLGRTTNTNTDSRDQGNAVWASFAPSPLASIEDLHTTHCPSYVRAFCEGSLDPMQYRRIGFPRGHESVNRALSSVGGTVAATRDVCLALRRQRKGQEPTRPLFAGHIAGGTHHAFRDRGEGFCAFSDIAVAANVALRDYADVIERILIVDLDVHQGNGNAVLFQDQSNVFTLSVHCTANYFSPKEASHVDIEVPEGTGDGAYLSLLAKTLPDIVREFRPDLIFYQSGVDCLKTDRFGKLSLSRGGLQTRNRLVYEMAMTDKHTPVPVVVTMGGGYPRDLEVESRSYQEVVSAHADVYVGAAIASRRLSRLMERETQLA